MRLCVYPHKISFTIFHLTPSSFHPFLKNKTGIPTSAGIPDFGFQISSLVAHAADRKAVGHANVIPFHGLVPVEEVETAPCVAFTSGCGRPKTGTVTRIVVAGTVEIAYRNGGKTRGVIDTLIVSHFAGIIIIGTLQPFVWLVTDTLSNCTYRSLISCPVKVNVTVCAEAATNSSIITKRVKFFS